MFEGVASFQTGARQNCYKVGLEFIDEYNFSSRFIVEPSATFTADVESLKSQGTGGSGRLINWFAAYQI